MSLLKISHPPPAIQQPKVKCKMLDISCCPKPHPSIRICTLLGRSLQYCASDNTTLDLHLGKENVSYQNPKFFLLNKDIELTQYTICGIVLSFHTFKN